MQSTSSSSFIGSQEVSAPSDVSKYDTTKRWPVSSTKTEDMGVRAPGTRLIELVSTPMLNRSFRKKSPGVSSPIRPHNFTEPPRETVVAAAATAIPAPMIVPSLAIIFSSPVDSIGTLRIVSTTHAPKLMNFLGLFFLIVISPMIRLCKFPKCSAAVIQTNLTKF